MVTGGSPLPSGYLPLTDPASAAASSAASLASAVTAGDTEERVRKGPVDPHCGSPLELNNLRGYYLLPEDRGTCVWGGMELCFHEGGSHSFHTLSSTPGAYRGTQEGEASGLPLQGNPGETPGTSAPTTRQKWYSPPHPSS